MALWKERSEGLSQTKTFSNKNCPVLISQIIEARGYLSNQIDNLLYPRLSDLKDPFVLKGMSEAVQRIANAYLQEELICIYADFDLDGTSGLAILKQALESLGFKKVLYYQPKRLSEGYGFHPHAVEDLYQQGVRLIITVDVGITSHSAFQKARQLGVDVILTDHHLPSETLPDAYCIVNPNQKECQSGLGYLCGAGVAFYLSRALKRYFLESAELPHLVWDLKSLLDLFCIGTLTDMVPLIEDNRVLVKHGMIALQNTVRPGLRALLESLNLANRPLSSQDISIKFAPKLNALSRMESDILPVHIYLETSEEKAQSMVAQILQNNIHRQQLQSSAESLAFEMIKDWKNDDFVFVSSKEFHRGIIGLIATKLSQDLQRPAFVGAEDTEEMIVGSSRLPQGHDSSLVEALSDASEFLNRFGGHSAAAGFELLTIKKNHLIEKLTQYYQNLKLNPKELEIEYDARAQLADINSHLMKWYDHLGPYGVGFQIPLFRFSSLQLLQLNDLKGGHLKLKLQQKNTSQEMDALFFSPTETQYDLIRDIYNKNKSCEVLGELQWNYFKQKQTLQLLVKDIRYEV